ncbi:MAG: GNAT family N-acetyltransferase [Simkaniaceae bacterium]|nr:GNAT family N-acetyltransferase [Simkaniaceae bacterium]
MTPIPEDHYRSASSVSLSPEGESFIIAGAEYPLTRDHLKDIEVKTQEIAAYTGISSKDPKIKELAALEIAISLPPPPRSLVERTLYTVSVFEEEQPQICATVTSWAALIRTKVHAWKRYLKCTPLSSEESSSLYYTIDILKESYRIIKQIKNFLEINTFGTPHNDRLYVCYDEANVVQAIALVEKRTNHLYRLATHPNNLYHLINNSIQTRIKGAATQLIVHLSKQITKHQNPLRLEAVHEARLFYQKLGFKRERGTRARSYDAFDLTLMKLHPSTVRRLEKDAQSPFFKEE